MNEKQRELIVILFAAAMAWVESATVFYLRTLSGRIQPYQSAPLSMSSGTHLAGIEAIREFATLIMLVTVGCLAGSSWRSRIAYGMIAFGIWDMLYYVFLAAISPWPRSIWDWDVLFLLPLPWWGPVIAPVIVSALLIMSGTLITQNDRSGRPFWPKPWAVVTSFLGAGLALYVFMMTAIHVILLGDGDKALSNLLPTRFDWPLFIAAVILMAAPLFDLIRQLLRRGSKP
jgi:hypothetical protein